MGIYVLNHPKQSMAAGFEGFGEGLAEKVLPKEKPETCCDTIAIDLPLYASERHRETGDHLGCVRGIAFALAIQAGVALFAFALWRIF